jgi:hypothetical protein
MLKEFIENSDKLLEVTPTVLIIFLLLISIYQLIVVINKKEIFKSKLAEAENKYNNLLQTHKDVMAQQSYAIKELEKELKE